MIQACKKVLRPVYIPVVRWICKLCKFLPVSEKYILFESEIDFAENSRALYEYMVSAPEYSDYKFIWNVKEPHIYQKRNNTVFLCRNEDSLRWNYYLNRCKYLMFTHPYWLSGRKKNQLAINLCHGNNFKATPANPQTATFDVSLASSEAWAKYRKLDYRGDFDVVVLGAPRNDYLLSPRYDCNYLAEFLDTSQFRKIIYCMPTFKKAANWQDGKANNPYSINVVSNREELYALNDALREKNVLLVCIIHHLQVMDEMVTGKLSNILYLRDEEYAKKGFVMNNMLRCADALVTDFSGVFLDFILLDRPIGFFCNDQDQYTRGYAMDNPQDFMPGPRMYTMEDFLKFVDDVCTENDRYKEFRKSVRDQVHKYQDDQNCRRFLEYFSI